MPEDTAQQQEVPSFVATIGNWIGTIKQKVLRPKRVSKDGAKTTPAKYTFRPVFTTADEAKAFFDSILDIAESANPGSGVALAHRWLDDQFDESYQAAVKPDGSFEDEDLYKQYTDPQGGEHRRGLADLNEKQEQLSAELSRILLFVPPPGVGQDVLDKIRAEREAQGLSEQDVARIYVQTFTALQNVIKLKADREVQMAENKRKREEAKKKKAVAEQPKAAEQVA